MFKKFLDSFRQYVKTKQFVQITMIIGVIMLAVNILYQYKWVGERTYINKKNITSAIESILNEHSSVCSQWVDASDVNKDLYLERIWQFGHSNSQYKKRVSIFLFDQDSMVYWSYSIYSGDVTQKVINSPWTITTINSSQVLVYNFWDKSKEAALVINLYDKTGGYNPYIFSNDNITLHPYREGDTIDEHDILINAENTYFVVEPHIRQAAPVAITIIGWLGVVMILLSIRRYARLRTTRLNSLLVSSVVLVIFLIIRVVLNIYNIPGYPAESSDILPQDDSRFISVGNLVVTFVFAFIYMVYLFSVRYKIKWKLLHYGKTAQFIIFLIAVTLADIVIVYFHYAGVSIAYNSSINTQLYNLYVVNLNGLLFYLASALFLCTRVLASRLEAICFSQYSFIVKLVISLSVLSLMLIPLESQIHHSGYLLVIFHAIFLGLTLFRRKFTEHSMFVASLIVVTIYITIFTTVETSAVRDDNAVRYSETLANNAGPGEDDNISFDYISFITSTDDPKYADMTYTIFSDQGTETKAGNNLIIEKLMPMAKFERDTIISEGLYKHIVRHNKNYVIITSYQKTSPLDTMTLFVYIFILLYLISLPLLRLSKYDPRKIFGWSKLAFRIRSVVIGVVVFTMTTIVVVVVNFSFDNYSNAQRQIINDNSRNLVRSFNTYASSYQGKPDDILTEWYTNSGASFDYIIFLYDLDGNLINHPANNQTTPPSRISSEAFRHLKWNEEPHFKKYNKNNLESFTSAFTTMYYNHEVIGYMNFVYYDHMGQLSDPKFILLNNILNVFVIILTIALFVSLLLYRKITDPLKQLHDALRNIAQMQKIPIDRSREISDEVGELALQYNMMIDYLEESYAQLAKSEREGAWREMALQVAHEIKNPLTPMRLKIQMLQRSRAQNDPKLVERLDATLITLLEQIDMLSNIATEFSDFARLSEGTPKHINIGNMLKNVSELYTNYDNIEVRFQQDSVAPLFVNADYQQLSRVIINLCQNAIQAIGTTYYGLITIRLSKQGRMAQIDVTDNGGGIPEEIRSKIFLPSFTTKSSGSGLGLAISQEILKNVGATIEFDSVMDIGTTFTIKIPMVK